jgi:hypothetical protein
MSDRIRLSRRRVLLGMAAGCSGVSALASQAPKVLTEKDRIGIGGRGKEIIDKARLLGGEYLGKYGNCAQATLAAIQDSVPFVPKDEMVFLAATPLSGAATRTHNASCGAFTGCGLAIGSVCGRSRANFAGKAPLAGQLLLQVHDNFVTVYGSVICNDVRAKAGGKCADVVAGAAAWAAEALLKQFTNYRA